MKPYERKLFETIDTPDFRDALETALKAGLAAKKFELYGGPYLTVDEARGVVNFPKVTVTVPFEFHYRLASAADGEPNPPAKEKGRIKLEIEDMLKPEPTATIVTTHPPLSLIA